MSVFHRFVLFRLFSAEHYRLFPLMVILVAGTALVMPVRARRLANAIHRVFFRVSQRPIGSALIAGMLSLAAGALFFAAPGLPVPYVHDEFSYLLAADTFAHGRLTNPPHPFWEHFESFYVNQQPTYASMYPPGQGLVLAAGTVLFGHPWFGVLASVVTLCMVTGWALRAWLPATWAFTGGLMAAALVPFSYWMTSYWGGAVAAIGGALVLGAWPRLKRRPAARESLLFALGAVILANSRMYEGAVLVAVAGLDLLFSSIRRPAATLRVYLVRVLFPAAMVLAAAAAWMMFYFWRVTGNPLLMPYVLNVRTYNSHRLFPWQDDPPPPVYRHAVMERLYSARGREHTGLINPNVRLAPVIDHYGGTLLILPLCAGWWLARNRKIRGLLIATVAVTLAVVFSPWILAHYLAPVMVGYIGLTLKALEYLSALRIGARRAGWFTAHALLVLWLGAQWKTGIAVFFTRPTPPWALMRASLQSQLELTGERNLILVRYEESHDLNNEWVYNGADLFNAPVLWAREMSPEQDLDLIRYYRPQAVWLLEADRARISEYRLPEPERTP